MMPVVRGLPERTLETKDDTRDTERSKVLLKTEIADGGSPVKIRRCRATVTVHEGPKPDYPNPEIVADPARKHGAVNTHGPVALPIGHPGSRR